MKSVARRTSDRKMLRLIKMWLTLEEVVAAVNRKLLGWSQYFSVGTLEPAYKPRRLGSTPSLVPESTIELELEVGEMRKVLRAKALNGYRVELEFDDGVRGTANLADLAGEGVFSLWDDYHTFERVEVGPSGELVWGGKVDLCADSLYLRVTGKKPTEVFPALRRKNTDA